MLLTHERFELMASAAPDAIAVRFLEASLTYGELNARANRLARYLVARGVSAEARIVVALEPGLEIAVALLAIWKAGGVYVPLDPSYPPARQKLMLSDIAPAWVLTTSDVVSRLSLEGARVVELDRAGAELAALADEDLNLTLSPEQAAYVFYTSGTTGVPKGVLASQANLSSYLTLARERYGFTSSDVIPALARFSFSISLFELLSPLLAGGTLLLIERAHVLDLERLAHTLQGVTCFHAGPSLLRSLLQFIQQRYPGSSAFGGVRHASSGGDTVPVDVLLRLRSVFVNAEVFVIYGCSEISCMGTTYEVPRAGELEKTYVGVPFPGVTLRVVDETLADVPAGEVGEVLFSGPGVVTGYLNREQLTAERFIDRDGRRYYRTGDCGRLSPDGLLELLGRVDFQVKLGGIRIELGEIEHHLRGAPGVENAVVVAKERADGEKKLVAYVTIEAGDGRDAALRALQIRQHLAASLPEYMLPAQIVELEALPLNHNLKLDRRALPEPPADAERAGAALRRAPLTESEQRLAELFEHTLGISGVGLDDQFFDLGGQSSLALQLIVDVQRELGVTLTGLELLREPLEVLARLCDSRRGRAASAPAAAAAEASPADARQLFHFGRDSSLFGVLHGPSTAPVDTAVLICAPLGHEYLRAHFVLQRLARRLAQQGTPALRFDYYGCCDALGDSVDASCERWRLDIEDACAELRRRTQAKRVVGLGVRLGATLLASVAQRLELSGLALWDPVEQGREHVAQLSAAQRRQARAGGPRGLRWPRWTSRELLGSTYSRRLLRELEALSLVHERELSCPVRRLSTSSGWLDLTRLEDMLPDTGISQALERLVREAA